MRKNLNWLFLNTYPGQIMLQSWLTSQGIERGSSASYMKNGLLKRLDTGVYCRVGKEPTWIDAVYCLQTQWNEHVHIAGLTSLSQQGSAHYLDLNVARVWLSHPPRVYLPKWLEKVSGVKWYSTANNRLSGNQMAFIKEIALSNLRLKCSSPELAAYEIANNIPSLIDFIHADELFQSLMNLNPKKLQSILSVSDAIKTNRVFMFLAERSKHQWFKRLKVADITMGSGPRQIEVDGRLDKEYQITVPAKMVRNTKENEYY